MSNAVEIPIASPGAVETFAAIQNIGQQLDRLGTSASQAAPDVAKVANETKKVGDQKSSITGLADSFNELREAISSILGKLGEVVDMFAGLSDEGQRLSEAQNRLGLDFERASRALGRYVDETDAMTAATALAARGIMLSQTELEAMVRVAGHYANDTGRDLNEAFESLGEVITQGGEESARFGLELGRLGDTSHTAQERLNQLVVSAARLPPLTDTAATSMARFRDSIRDAARTVATQALEQFAALSMQLDAAANSYDDATGKQQEFENSLREVGTFVGEVAVGIVEVVRTAVTGIRLMVAVPAESLRILGVQVAAIRAGNVRGAVEAIGTFGQGQFMRDALEASEQQFDRIMRLADPDTHDAARRVVARADEQRRETAERRRQELEATDRAARSARQAGGGAGGPSASDIIERSFRAAREESERRRGGASAPGMADMFRQRQDVADLIARERELATARAEMLDATAEKAQAANQAATELEDTFGRSRIADYFSEQARSATSMADTVTNAYQQMVGAMGEYITSTIDGSMVASEAAEAFARSTLSSLGKVAAQQALFETGKGLAALFVAPAAASSHFAAAGVFAAVAVGTGLAVRAMGKPSAATGAAAGGAERSSAPTSRDSASAGGGTTIVQENYYAPVIGGRSVGDGETGRIIGRYQTEAQMRQRRQREGGTVMQP